MDDTAVRREFSLPTGRDFSISGSAVLSNLADDAFVDRALGLPDAAHGGITATSGNRLDDVRARASLALDGDPTTAWNTPIDGVVGAQMRVVLPSTRTIDHLDLQITADGRHSVPTAIRITGADGSRVVTLGTPSFFAESGVDTVPVRFAPLTGRTISITIIKRQPLVKATNPGFVELPVGIAELGIPGVRTAPVPDQLPGTCISGLFAIDGHPVSVRVTGSTADAIHERPLTISPCTASEALTLGPGPHHLTALFNGHGSTNATGFDLQRLVLASAADGQAAPAASIMTKPAGDTDPAVTVERQGPTSMTLHVAASSGRQWLVLGESLNQGWHATIAGHDLGAPRLVDGYANGWLLPANLVGQAVTVKLDWTPQRLVWVALWLSLAGALACLTILAAPLRRRRRRAISDQPLPDQPITDEPLSDPLAATATAGIALRPALLEQPLRRRSAASTVAVIGLAVAAAVVVRPWVGVVVGGLAFWALRDRRARLVVRYAPAVILVVIAAYMALAQAIHHYPTGTHWPAIWAWARVPTWFALFLLLSDAVVERVGRRDDDAP